MSECGDLGGVFFYLGAVSVLYRGLPESFWAGDLPRLSTCFEPGLLAVPGSRRKRIGRTYVWYAV